MRYALIDNGVVVNVVEADSPGLFADYDTVITVDGVAVQPGWYYDGTGFSDPGYSGPWTVTKLAFRNRFTINEKAMIEFAALDSPSGSLSQRMQAATLRAMMADQAVATFIDLKRDDTRSGVQMLEDVGLIATGRAVQILDTIPTDSELYKA